MTLLMFIFVAQFFSIDNNIEGCYLILQIDIILVSVYRMFS